MSNRDATAEANATSCATFVDEWVQLGLADAVVCPGSRSTPMAVALASDPRIRVHVHHDERSGSFMALGLGRATGRPALVLTTSGTAAVQLHAAVVEADLDHVPLLVVTADRPPRLRGVGAPQTIDQVGLYGGSVRWALDAPLPTDVEPSHWRTVAREAWGAALGTDPGPVHLNLPFDEPLLGVPSKLPPALAPFLAEQEPAVALHAELLSAIATRSGVIVAGTRIDDPDAVLSLAARLGWPVLADPRSGCRVPHPNVIAHADGLLRADALELPVTAVLRFGSLPASKIVNQWLAKLEVPHIHCDPTSAIDDPDQSVSLRVTNSASALVGAISLGLGDNRDNRDDGWLRKWRDADDAFEMALVNELQTFDVPTEPGSARAVLAAMPADSMLVVSSSMPIRDIEWFGETREGVTVHCNRGANGIDGVVSTAVGVALAGKSTALLIGDVAFLHDTNGLLGLGRRDVDLCIVVINNDGGGIFSFLPQATTLDGERFEQLFGTPHGVDLAALAHAHGLPVLTANDDDAVGVAVQAAFVAGGVHIVMAVTNRSDNVLIHDQLQRSGLEAARNAGWN